MNEKIHFRCWTPGHRKALQAAGGDLRKMLAVTLDVASVMPPGIEVLSGPMTTGGVGFLEGNLFVHDRGVEVLSAEGANMLSYRPFRAGMIACHDEWKTRKRPGEDYNWDILHIYYDGLFASRKISVVHFLFGYQSSTGARWEHEQAERYGIKKRYLPRKLTLNLIAEFTATGVLG